MTKITDKAKLIISGSICGDIIGSAYEWEPVKTTDFNLFSKNSTFTDDTVCTIAVADAIATGCSFQEKMLQWCHNYPHVGYGSHFRKWQTLEIPLPYGSWGNGSAMRVSPAGAYANSLDEALSLAKDSASITHNHPEGIKGAQAVAAAIYLALNGSSKKEIKDYIERKFYYNLSRYYTDIQPDYSFDVSCAGSVPESIICFLESHDYESAIRLAVAFGGDADTMAAITGGIAAAYYGIIPEKIIQKCESLLPEDMKSVIDRFNASIDRHRKAAQEATVSMTNRNKFCYAHPHPSVSTDCVIFGFDGTDLKVLLVKRGVEPHKGIHALPGGFIKYDESAEKCAERELKEETGLKCSFLRQLRAYSDPWRDNCPEHEGRVITIAFVALVKMSSVKGNDDAASAEWVSPDNLPELAFDHRKIIEDARAYLRERIYFEPVGYDLLPEKFTLKQLQTLYQSILGIEFDRRNFAKKMQHLGLISRIDDEEVWMSTRRPSYLFRFNRERYYELKKDGIRLEF